MTLWIKRCQSRSEDNIYATFRFCHITTSMTRMFMASTSCVGHDRHNRWWWLSRIGARLPDVASSQNYIKSKFFHISKFGAKRQILIFGRTSTRVSHQLKFEELQLRIFKQGVLAIKRPNVTTLVEVATQYGWSQDGNSASGRARRMATVPPRPNSFARLAYFQQYI